MLATAPLRFGIYTSNVECRLTATLSKGFPFSAVFKCHSFGRAGGIRTHAYWSQSPVPYRLATALYMPYQNYAGAGVGFTPELLFTGCNLCTNRKEVIRNGAFAHLGADDGNRTHNILSTKQMLCHLSYTGIERAHHARGAAPAWHLSSFRSVNNNKRIMKKGAQLFAGGAGRRI